MNKHLARLYNTVLVRRASSFSPASISGLEAWFSSSDQANFSSKDAENGWTTCEQWDDLSGEDNHATQSGATAPFIEGNTLYFSNDTIELSDIGIGTDDFSAMVTFNIRTASAVGPMFSSMDSANGNGFLIRHNTDKTVTAVLRFANTSLFVNHATGLKFSFFYTAILSADRSGNATLRIFDENGDEVGSAATASISAHSTVDISTAENWHIGSDRGAAFSQTWIREVAFWRGTLTSDEFESLGSYVASTYPAMLPNDDSLIDHRFTWYNSDSFAEASGAVDEVIDLFGNHDLTNDTVARRPDVGVGINGYKSLDFSTHPQAALYKTSMTTPTMINMIVVAKFTADSFTGTSNVFGGGLSYSSSRGHTVIGSYQSGTNRICAGHYDGARYFGTNDTATAEQWRIILLRVARRNTGTTTYLWDYTPDDSIDNISQSTLSPNGDGVLDAFSTNNDGTQDAWNNWGMAAFGGGSARESFKGELIEAVAFDEATADGSFGIGQMLDIVHHLRDKYGI